MELNDFKLYPEINDNLFNLKLSSKRIYRYAQ